MTAETASGFTAEDAVRTLDKLKGYEETLTARTAGLTILVWAFVVTGIPLAYQGLWGWLAAQGTWGLIAANLLWVPWVAAGITATVALWRTHSISLERTQSSRWKDWLIGIGFTALFFLIAGGVILTTQAETNTFTIMGVTTGLFTLVLALFNHLQYRRGLFWPLYAAGIVILLTGLVLVTTGADRSSAAFTTAFVQGTAYFLAGITMVARG